MPPQACIVSDLTLDLPTHTLFQQLSFVLHAGQVSGLIGRNGLGKSLLFQILHQQNTENLAFSGCITWHLPHDYLAQVQRLNTETIAQALGIEHFHHAFQRIENATACFADYELVENHWDLQQQWQQMLNKAMLPTDLDFSIANLSEGQKTRLALCRLFLKKDHYLLLDEPSNHLDVAGRKWLIESIQAHQAGVCLISHDRHLLNQVQHIYALSEHGIQHVARNYEDYVQYHQLQIHALTQDIQQQKREFKQLKQHQHESLMKAQKRQAKGKQLHDGSQAKILLDFKKEQAGQSFGKLRSQQARQQNEQHSQLMEKQTQLEKIKPQRFEFHFQAVQTGEILRIKDLKLPFSPAQNIKLALQAGQKIHLKGRNGIGKSTLLKWIKNAELHNCDQHLTVFMKCNSIYLDQAFSLFNAELSVLQNLAKFNAVLSEVEWRNLLGQLRIRREKALLQFAQLSGGEKLKVALLAISHAQNNIDLLLLDEPDNHLDMESKQLLADAIQQYQGAVILVLHDDYFVRQCKISEAYELR